MAELMNLIIGWVLSVVLAAGIGFLYAKRTGGGKKKTVMSDRVSPTAEELYAREKRAREERNFWNYDGTRQEE